jgi:hypothetical protein
MNLVPTDAEVIIEFPFRLDCELKEVRLAEDVLIQQIDNATRTRTLGIDKVVFDENGMLNSTQATILPDFQPGVMPLI